MDELGSMWSYQESFDDLKQKLLYTNLELETVRAEANDEIKRSKENVTSLLNLLKVAYQERDEARDQLQKLLNKLKPSSPIDPQNTYPITQPDLCTINLVPTKANSSITESNSHSHNSSPVSSFFDAVSSPDNFNTINMADSSNFMTHLHQIPDPFESLVNGKSLPQKGKLLQAVMDAGPLLSTLLVAGPLPRWRNPPPLQSFKIPPVAIKGCESNQNRAPPKQFFEMSCGSAQFHSNNPSSMLNFRSGSALNGGRLLTSSSSGSGLDVNNQVQLAKRQRYF